MATRFTVSLPDDVMVGLTHAATEARRTPKAQAEWELIQRFKAPPPAPASEVTP